MAFKHLKRVTVCALVVWHILFFYIADVCSNVITLHPHPYIVYNLSIDHYGWIIDQWQQNPHWMNYSEVIFLVKFVGFVLAIALVAFLITCKEALLLFRKRHLILFALGVVTINLITKIMIEWFVRDYRIYMTLFSVETVYIILAILLFMIQYDVSSHAKKSSKHA